ncbi:MORN repeat-containing protein 3 isoform X2 [Pseudophryne corroboree]
MPFLKQPSGIELPWKTWDKKAQKSGLRHTVYSVNGDQYTGEWLNNMKHGRGTHVWKNTNAIYEGEWKCGKRSGFGAYSVRDPSTGDYVKVYSGSWENDKKHGYGTYYYSDKEYYEGDWEAGQRSGWGRMYFAIGDMYEGEWRKDKQCGQGLLLKANGNRYEGAWKGAMKHGPGTFYYLDKGQVYDGVWENDIPKCGTMEDFGHAGPIPEVKVVDPEGIIKAARSSFLQ